MSSSKFAALAAYSACDIADVLLRLEVPGAGYLPDITPIPNPQSSASPLMKTIAPASTILFTQTSTSSFPSPKSSFSAGSIFASTFSLPNPNIPKGMHWADMTLPGSIAVLSQPDGQSCAALGGVMATRMKVKGVKAVVVSGKVRDLGKLREIVRGEAAEGESVPDPWRQGQPVSGSLQASEHRRRRDGMPIWSRGTSVVDVRGEARPWAVNVMVRVGQTEVCPGDIVMLDPEERGAVCVPAKLVDKVLEMLPRLVEGDGKVLQHVESGGTVSDAFKMYRGK
ncbi:hypothetical protein NA57DRAFT_70574 [Rhizodiscina lignyota]|uniref:RraA-like protein n=1 Tax=Rhizodiscina lignyota TaxID=1504668 RepID=A0A9P4MED9_9PEZI|nr:hypothetical protein NA57DRAFT_70574 [Rhizodiscina lignyota]